MPKPDLNRVRGVVENALDDLPDPIRQAIAASNITIDIVDRPPDDMPDVFGTFSGGTVFEQESTFEIPITEPARIELYLSTFADLESSPEEYENEIYWTVIHEIGHFLGFEEADLEDV